MYLYHTRILLKCTPISAVCHLHVPACHPSVAQMYSYIIHVSLACPRLSCKCYSFLSYTILTSLACTRMLSLSHLYILVDCPYLTCMHQYILQMSLVCTRISSICHLNVLICLLYVNGMYLYVICMSLVCTRMSFVCHSNLFLYPLFLICM